MARYRGWNSGRKPESGSCHGNNLFFAPQDESEEESEPPTGTPGHRGVAPWLADAAKAGGKPTAPAAAAEPAPAAHSVDPDASLAGSMQAEEQRAPQADAAGSSAMEEPALSSLQTVDEPQRLDIADMPHPHPDSTATEVCSRLRSLPMVYALDDCRGLPSLALDTVEPWSIGPFL